MAAGANEAMYSAQLPLAESAVLKLPLTVEPADAVGPPVSKYAIEDAPASRWVVMLLPVFVTELAWVFRMKAIDHVFAATVVSEVLTLAEAAGLALEFASGNPL